MSTNTVRRVKLASHAPEFYQALIALDEVSALGIDPKLAHLVRIRASQLNGCAYCLDMHALDARHEGDTEQRVNLVATWREARKFYTEQEQAAFELTEAITLISVDHVPDAVYEIAAKAFDQKELAQLIGLIIMINAWNRVGVSCRLEPGHYDPS
ncbi:carboxymuconolactone decarboxylase family protein [Kribbella sp. NPDC056861]|uniref:carboxymuconolactone decarboxylase family protein n=1 Tax=Kribbella sp. NPDC056861 TaxID=3154857 RepID=UPI003414D8BF